jgi:Domain of unknown function (DUF5134)
MMGIPGFILDIFAALMLLVAAVSAGRLVLDRPWQRGGVMDADVDGSHVLMGIAMAGMLVASLTTLSSGAWIAIFSILTAWFAWCVYREARGGGAQVLLDSHHAPHLVHGAAMVYMFAAITAPAAGHGSGMSMGMGGAGGGMSTLAVPALAFIFAILLAGYAVVDLDRLSGPAPHGSYASAIAPGGAALAGAAAGSGTAGPAPTSAAAVRPEGGVATLPDRAASPARSAGAAGHGGGSVRDLLLNPRTAAGCRITMGVTMAFMLVIMI